uniref:GTP-binding protein REM 1 n=1 Tax=Mesocestoides corti TaxID=53468 RepID=A0A5K3EGE0_MESCO
MKCDCSKQNEMPGNSNTLGLREMFRFRSMQRHRRRREERTEVPTEADEADSKKTPLSPLPVFRVQCDPSFDAEDFELDLYRVRSFKRTSKGLISLGDSFRSRSTSNCSHLFQSSRCSTTSAQTSIGCSSVDLATQMESLALRGHCDDFSTARKYTTFKGETSGHNLTPAVTLCPPSPCSSLNNTAPVKVQILGGPTVGKTTLCRQFLTAEFMGGRTESFSEDSIERFVVIEVDGWNRSLMLIDNIREEASADVSSTEAGASLSGPFCNIEIPSSLLSEAMPRHRPMSFNCPTISNITRGDTCVPQTGSSLSSFKPDDTSFDKKAQSELEIRILDADIYVVVYAVDGEASFKVAKTIFRQLHEIKNSDNKLRLLYLVGNKTDLVRCRQVTTQIFRNADFQAVQV